MKRIVFVHPDGLHQILAAVPDATELPTVLNYEGAVIQLRDRLIPFASLVRVTERIAFYKEPLVPSSHTYTKDAGQR